MNYIGKLYGKIGNKYFYTSKTGKDFDELIAQLKKSRLDLKCFGEKDHAPMIREIDDLIKKFEL